ncbi:MAG: Dinucleotide-utilizing enzymes involved in molybdopterin and thiamine biosynthesis family 2 [Rhodobacteraceae bacterium HLUCCA12]|nr:MAG: Dinucleotide-utilizing enzymes involved in molybdopterin and thiamine biosynthesis family 2 [Rhodobacteraceae bacterium HLUCCA12]
MFGVIALGVAIWALATVLRVPLRIRLALVGVLWAVVVLINLTLPAGSPLRTATGNDARPWLVLAGAAALVLAYRAGLGALRRRVRPQAPAADAPDSGGAPFSEVELNRYARHIILREVGGPGQRKLKDARVLVIGAGGLGAPVLLYLAGAGVGTIGVIDDDTVEGSNLQRQIIHTDARIGLPKVFSAQEQMLALNPFVTVRPYHRRLTESDAEALFSEYDLILDGTDNMDTRYLVNRVAVRLQKPLVSAAITQWEGQIGLYDPARGGACYECVFPHPPAPGLVPSCAEAGVIGPLPGVLGSMMAVEAIKAITGAGEGLRGRLLIYDALFAETRTIATRPRPDCAACHGGAAASA